MVGLTKRMVLLLSVLSIIIVILSSSVLAVATSADFQLILEEQNPDPVEPGEVVTIELKVQNDGTATTDDVIITVDPQYPLTIYESEDQENIGAMENGEVVSSIEFSFLVDDSAAQGDASIDVYVTMEGSDASSKETFTIDVETRDAVLDITNVELSPEQIAPGEEFDLLITLTNEADSLLQSIYATINTSDGQPVVAYLSSSEKVISSLSSGEAITLHYKLLVDPSFEHGLYRVPFELSYEDRSGNSYTSIEYLSLFVTDTTQIDLQVRSSALYKGDKTGKVVFELANVGQGELKAVQLEVMDGEDYSVLSTQSRYYIGNVDSDDTETEEMIISVNSRKDYVDVLVRLNYLDALNTEYTEDFTLSVPIYSHSEAVEIGIAEARSYTGLIILLLLIIGGVYWYRKKTGKGSLWKDLKKLKMKYLKKKK